MKHNKQNSTPKCITKISKQNGEYRIRLFCDGIYQAGADGFEYTKEDALATAAAMEKRGRWSDPTTDFAKDEQVEYEAMREDEADADALDVLLAQEYCKISPLDRLLRIAECECKISFAECERDAAYASWEYHSECAQTADTEKDYQYYLEHAEESTLRIFHANKRIAAQLTILSALTTGGAL